MRRVGDDLRMYCTEGWINAEIVEGQNTSSTEYTIQSLPPELINILFSYLDLKTSWRARAISQVFYTAFKETDYQARLTKAAAYIHECVKERIQSGIPWEELYSMNHSTFPVDNQEIRFIVDRFENLLIKDGNSMTIGETLPGDYLYPVLRAATQEVEATTNTQKLRWQIEVCILHEELRSAISARLSRKDIVAMKILKIAKPIFNLTDVIISFSASFGLQVARSVLNKFSLRDACDSIQATQENLMNSLDRRTRARFKAFFDACWREVIQEVIAKKAVSIECVCNELNENFPPITAFGTTFGRVYIEEQEEFIRYLFGQPELSSFVHEKKVIEELGQKPEEPIR